MPLFSICNNKFALDDPHVIDPRANSGWVGIGRGQLPQVIADGFAEPIDFPPIPQAVMPEDSIAIAVEPDTPCGLEIARLVAARFVEQGSEASRVTIVCAEKDPNEGADYVVHEPGDSEQMAFLVVDQTGVPFYVNKTLFEADIVVPIGSGDRGRDGNSICPAFCDLETREYISNLPENDSRAAARMVDSNLGVFWQVRIVTGPGDQIVEVMIGSSQSVLQKSGQLGSDVWRLPIDQPADMILATIESRCCQTWSNLRQAILNADKVATDNAIIVVCTDMGGHPPSTWPIANRETEKQDYLLGEVFERKHVYLASRLKQDSAERFGFGHLETSEQIQKLIDQHETCLLLRDAHRIDVSSKEEA